MAVRIRAALSFASVYPLKPLFNTVAISTNKPKHQKTASDCDRLKIKTYCHQCEIIILSLNHELLSMHSSAVSNIESHNQSKYTSAQQGEGCVLR